MKSKQLLDQLEFHEAVPFAQPLLVEKDLRILRWMLKPGQSIIEHSVPHSAFCVVILKGHGKFTASDGKEQKFGPNDLLVFEKGEAHTVQALDEDLVFVGFLQGAPGTREEHVSGEMAN